MGGVNLVPAHRRIARRRARRVRLWCAVCAVYTLALTGAFGGASAAGRYDANEAEHRLREAEADVEQRRRQIITLVAEAERARRTIEANRGVGDQPDWSVLLSLVATILGDDAALRRCALEPTGTERNRRGQPRPEQRPKGYTLRLVGLAQAQRTVSDIAIRLEQTGLFQKVELLESRRETLRGGDAIVFTIECVLTEQNG